MAIDREQRNSLERAARRQLNVRARQESQRTPNTPRWTQPESIEEAYSVGDQVRYKTQMWVSTSDLNVWEPGVSD